MSSIIAGLSKLPLAKIIDIWGRPQGIALMTFFWVIGFVMMAATTNVEMYAAAQVFSLVGYVLPPFLGWHVNKQLCPFWRSVLTLT